MSSPQRLLFISRLQPSLGAAGAHVYSHDVLTFLAGKGWSIDVLLLQPWVVERSRARFISQPRGVRYSYYCPTYIRVGRSCWHPRGIIRSLQNRLYTRLGLPPPRPEPPQETWGNPVSPAETEVIQRVARQSRWGTVIANYCWLADALRHFDGTVRKAILTHDVWHKHVLRDSHNPHLQDLDRDAERDYLRAADLIIAITEADRRDFAEMLPQKEIVVAPMSCTPRSAAGNVVPGRLLIVGSRYSANAEGAAWFLREVGPRLEAARPGHFELHVAGAVCGDVHPSTGGVRLIRHGVVPDLAPHYAAAEVVVVPLLQGTGLKIKLVEALAFGKAVVTTPAGAQGVESFAGEAFHIADTPQALADRILHLASDPTSRRALESAALQTASKHFSAEACYRDLLQALARPRGVTPRAATSPPAPATLAPGG